MKTNSNIKRIVNQHEKIYNTKIDVEFSRTSCVYIGYYGLNDKLMKALVNSLKDETTTVRVVKNDNSKGRQEIYLYRDFEYINGKKLLI